MNYEMVVATQNEHKMKEYRELIKNLPIVLYSLNDLNLNLDIDENGTTYEENSLIKALAVSKYTKLPIISDDSGIEIEAFGNKIPGIHSHRFQIEHDGAYNTNLFVLKELEKVTNRHAKFVCQLCILNIEDKPLYFKGETLGEIDLKVTTKEGFGFDPIFFSYDIEKNLGIASKEEKNTISHRYRAFNKFLTYLKIYNKI